MERIRYTSSLGNEQDRAVIEFFGRVRGVVGSLTGGTA